MPVDENQTKQSHRTIRRLLQATKSGEAGAAPSPVELVKWSVYGFLEKLQKRYPFNFSPARRDVRSERNRAIQERHVTHYLMGAIAELAGFAPEVTDWVWVLAGQLSNQIGRGGENFRPREFKESERTLAQKIGEPRFTALLQSAENLSCSMHSRIGPVNSSDHVLCWSFRYVGQLLKAAKWESVPRP